MKSTSSLFPRASAYRTDWIVRNASGGANPLWLTEWLAADMHLEPGMKVLDLGCGRAGSSIFLHREFKVQVWATDLWFNPSENRMRIQDCGAGDGVFPLHADARKLPFANEFFDAVVCVDSYPYFGTDDLYLNYLARFLKPNGTMGIVGAGLVRELENGVVPEHLRGFWSQSLWCLHSADWWKKHWERTGIVRVDVAETMEDGWRLWLDWHSKHYPNNEPEINALTTDAGRYLGYIRVLGRRQESIALEEPVTSIPIEYEKGKLLQSDLD